ncbi:MAG: hypothetical protein HC912_13130 [Saprospiraceae bacterium]|nr:hypothetical protein [Saprospiraceae bacterium]
MTFLELAEKVLKETQVPMKTSEIWEYGVKKGYTQQLNSSGKTPWNTLAAQVYVNVRDNNNSIFGATENSPKKFYLKAFKNIDLLIEQSEKDEIAKIETEEKELRQKNYSEKELHPVLAYFAYYHLRCYTRTINHSKSSKKTFGEWVHPDMVGCYFPIEDWATEVNELSSTVGNPAIKIYSFELKRKVTLTNLREIFFQTVSNSSWANESYLVVAEVAEDEDLTNELKRLSTSFGIGVIKLDINDPDNSEFLYPAKVSEYLDWETMNKLTMNKDFTEFLKRINNDLKGREIRKEWYDSILDKEKLTQKFK